MSEGVYVKMSWSYVRMYKVSKKTMKICDWHISEKCSLVVYNMELLDMPVSK